MTTAQEIVELARAAGMKRGNLRLKVEDFRAEAAKKNEQGNALLGQGFANLADEKFREQDFWYGMAEKYAEAARLM